MSGSKSELCAGAFAPSAFTGLSPGFAAFTSESAAPDAAPPFSALSLRIISAEMSLLGEAYIFDDESIIYAALIDAAILRTSSLISEISFAFSSREALAILALASELKRLIKSRCELNSRMAGRILFSFILRRASSVGTAFSSSANFFKAFCFSASSLRIVSIWAFAPASIFFSFFSDSAVL